MIALSFRRYLPVVAVLSVSIMLASVADQAVRGDETHDVAADKLPVHQVVLFTSGVGYFERHGHVDGNATLDFKFNVADINDLLKSMVLEDLGGGRISAVTYGSRDPITKTLKSFAVDLTRAPTLGQLLMQFRGEKVEIETPNRIQGTIIGVEKKKRHGADKQVTEIEYLNLLSDDGLRRIALDDVGHIKLTNADLDAELRKALAVLAAGNSTDKKTVALNFLGTGQREVRVGYIQETPVWKTTYRLLLDPQKKPFIQGWAIVENTTDADWSDVRLGLVSGRPISFIMDLYSPLYAQRPTIVPDLFASLRPQVYEHDLAAHDRESEDKKSPGSAGPRSTGIGGGGMGGGGGQAAGGPAFIPPADVDSLNQNLIEDTAEAVAQGVEVGALFRYEIKDPVTLSRQRSAMLPIINDAVEGEKVSIFDAAVNAKHPLNGFELKNTTDLNLMQGPLTVFDDGVYAGDARIPDLTPGGKQLLSYAVDLDIEVAPEVDARPQSLASARIEKGVLFTNHKVVRTQSYKVKNSGHVAKTVLIEYPLDIQWKLISPKVPTEKTRDKYRFAVHSEPGESTTLSIEEEQIVQQTVAVNGLDDNSVKVYLSTAEVKEPIKQALREVARRKAELVDLNRRQEQIEKEIATIGQEQDRIRHNMDSIGHNSDLYNRYVKKFTSQEDQIEKSRDESRSLAQKISDARQALEDYLANLNLS